MEMGGNFCQILELGGPTIKGRRVGTVCENSCRSVLELLQFIGSIDASNSPYRATIS